MLSRLIAVIERYRFRGLLCLVLIIIALQAFADVRTHHKCFGKCILRIER